MNEDRMDELVAKLNLGAAMIEVAENDNDKLPGARMISEVGAVLVEEGGKTLLEKAHGLAMPKHQNTISNQWFALADTDGKVWLP